MNNIKIAFIDIDGTLTDSKQMLSNENIEALKFLKNKGIKLVLSSGRWDTYMLKYNENLNLVDYIISNNGACIIDVKSKKVLKENILDKKHIDIISKYCIDNDINLTYNGLYKRFDINDNFDTQIYQGVIVCSSKEEIDNFVKFAEYNNLKISYISYSYYTDVITNKYTANICNNENNKGKSIKYLLDYLKIKKEDSICFGDNYNDIEMFDNCGIKVAMKNGLNDLKEKADYITLSNDDNGIAYFINNYIK